MKDNTLIYVGLGLAAVYLLSKKTVTAPNVLAPGQSFANIPIIQSGGSSGSIIPTLTALASQIANTVKQNNNVSQGYNADGTITVQDPTQQSINQIDQGQGLVTSTIPVIDTPVTSAPLDSNSSAPLDAGIPDELTDYTMF